MSHRARPPMPPPTLNSHSRRVLRALSISIHVDELVYVQQGMAKIDQSRLFRKRNQGRVGALRNERALTISMILLLPFHKRLRCLIFARLWRPAECEMKRAVDLRGGVAPDIVPYTVGKQRG